MHDLSQSLLRRKPSRLPVRQKFNAHIRLCEVTPSGVPGEFSATVNGELLVWSSRTPYTDAARVLIKEGADSNSILILRHAGSDVNAMTGKLGLVAKLAVREGNTEQPRFSPWKPYPSRAVASPVRQTPSALGARP